MDTRTLQRVGLGIAGGLVVVALVTLAIGGSRGRPRPERDAEPRRPPARDTAAPVSTGPVTIHGRVVDGGTKGAIEKAVLIVLMPGVTSQAWLEAPGEEATAELMAATTVTDAEGAYEIADLERGRSYTVMVTAAGYDPAIFESGLEVTRRDAPLTRVGDIELEAR